MIRLFLWISLCGWAQHTRGLVTASRSWTDILENPARDAYQRPEQLLDWIEEHVGTLRGRRVYDLGAGTGYYAWRMVRRGATVIAADIDESLLRYMERRRDSLGFSPQQWEVRKTAPDRPNIALHEADWILLADVYHHLSNRTAYLKSLHAALPDEGVLLLIEWAPRESPVGPPLSHRLFPAQVESELQAAGFEVIRLEETFLPYHYIMVARKSTVSSKQ